MDEREFIAAERALGVEPTAGETPAEAALRAAWEQRLAPMLLSAAPAEPPADMLERIEAEIAADERGAASRRPAKAPPAAASAAAPGTAEIVELAPLRRSVRVWKGVAGVALAAAAALALYVAAPGVIPGLDQGDEAPKYVAVVTADDGSGAGLIIEFDTGSGVATVVPVTTPPEGSSYQMWTIPEGQTRPVSLGLLPRDPEARTGLAPTPGQLFAISLEPEGGSPTGQPTQPLFHGTLERVE